MLNFWYGLVSGWLLGMFSSIFYYFLMLKLKNDFDDKVEQIHRNVMNYLDDKQDNKNARTKETNEQVV